MAKKLKIRSRPTRELKNVSLSNFIKDYIYRIDLDADYQREKIWSRADQERLLDSIVKNIDIPKIYLARVADSKEFDFECIDGKQRMTTLLQFFKPEPKEADPLTVSVWGEKYTYRQLQKEHVNLSKKIDDFELTLVIYTEVDNEEFLREIFRRLQLGVRLNSGELLKTYTGTLRDFIFKEMGNNAPFLRRTNLSEKRFSRPFTLAQICINSFRQFEDEEFVRARYDDLEEFFKEKANLRSTDENLVRIRKVLAAMDKGFKKTAFSISSRAMAVSAYLFSEELYVHRKAKMIRRFAKFFVALINEIDQNLTLLTKYKRPTNSMVLEAFQKYVSQASVEPYAIKRRHDFLKRAFAYYLDRRTQGRILGSR